MKKKLVKERKRKCNDSGQAHRAPRPAPPLPPLNLKKSRVYVEGQ